VIEGSGGLHSVIRRASNNDQRRIAAAVALVSP
jgi:hypothetical protein